MSRRQYAGVAVLLTLGMFVSSASGFGAQHQEGIGQTIETFSFNLPEDTQAFQQSLFMVDDGTVSTASPTALLELREHKLAPILKKLDKTKNVHSHEKKFSAKEMKNEGVVSQTPKNAADTGDATGNGEISLKVHYNQTHHGKAKAEITGDSDVQLTIGDLPFAENATEVCAFCNMEHGKCIQGECKCEEGWSGKDCTQQGLDQPSCPDWCVPPRGHCTSGAYGRALCQCAVGFGGADCKEKREMLVFREQHNLPLLHECPKCGSHGKCGAGPWDIPICYCDKGFSGPTCGDAVPPRPPGQSTTSVGLEGMPTVGPNDLTVCAFCSVNGECVNGTCKCYFGWGGVDCMDEVAGQTPCPENCNGHGKCLDSACMCETPYSGAACEVGPCPKDCSGHGTCFEGKCNCEVTWVGEDCGVKGNECPNQCSNHGTCQDDKTCKCEAEWGSEDCSKRICPGGGNCSGNGKCTNDGYCICKEGWNGVGCDVKKCLNDCNNNGECMSGVCKCNREWEGEDCSTPKKENICPKTDAGVCSAHGSCNPDKKKCECFPGYAGTACTELECANGCSGHGECKGDKTCVCEEGYFEADCSRYSRGEGCPFECAGHGTCKKGKCECDQGFIGSDCSEMGCPKDCMGNGKCVNSECHCNLGWAGLDCATNRCPFNCSGHGKCPEAGGQCQCDTGYQGMDCSMVTCPKNCTNRGKCIENMCVCDAGFSGVDCGTVRGAASGTVLEAMDEAADAEEGGGNPSSATDLSEAETGGGWVSGLRASGAGSKLSSEWEISPDVDHTTHLQQGRLRAFKGHRRHASHHLQHLAPRHGVVRDDDSDEPGYEDSKDHQEVDILPK